MQQTGTVRIVQTNAAGDNVHLIDPVTNTVVGEITGIERAHGAAPSPDGRSIYVANESTNTVDVVDVAMLKVIKKNSNVARLKDAFRWTQEAGMETLAYFIIGQQTETASDMLMSKSITFMII